MSEEKQLNEIIEIVKPFVSGCACEEESGLCELTDCRSCNAINLASKIQEAGYRKQSEGEWIDKPTGAYGRMQSWCSACGKHSGIGGIESNRHKPYCPNCGAKMKGGAE